MEDEKEEKEELERKEKAKTLPVGPRGYPGDKVLKPGVDLSRIRDFSRNVRYLFAKCHLLRTCIIIHI